VYSLVELKIKCLPQFLCRFVFVST
jgi:hypothetical protein